MNKRSGIGENPTANGLAWCGAIATLAIPEGKPLPCQLMQVQVVQHDEFTQQAGVCREVKLTPGMANRKYRVIRGFASTGGRMPVHQKVGIGVD